MDTDEMFERGVADAYMGDPHPFYYRHYEPYRQGYDQTRRRMRKTSAIPVIDVRRIVFNALFVVGLGVIGFVIYYFTTTTVIQPVLPKPTPVVLPTLPAASVMVFATNTPIPPTPEPLVLTKGKKARVQNTEGNPLRVRISPSTSAQVIAYVRDNQIVEIVEGPILADGYVWWQIKNEEGTGWSAEHDNEGTYWIVPVVDEQ